MAGIPSKSIPILILLTTARMLLRSAPLFLGQPLKNDKIRLRIRGINQQHSQESPECLTACHLNSFFLALRPDSISDNFKRSLQEQPSLVSGQVSSPVPTSSVITATCQGISPSIAPTLINYNADNHPQQPLQTQETNSSEVEYHLHSFYEHFETNNTSKNTVTVKNRLKYAFNFWKEIIKPSDYILNVISSGYRLEFSEIPQKALLKNNRSALDHADFTEKAILELVEKDLVLEMSEPPHCVNPLSVSMPLNRKPRLILDLRHVNACIVKRKVKFEGTVEGLAFAKVGNFMLKL